MPKLTKEETISALEAAILKHEGRKVTVDQKGSWYKIDGGKSLRFGELESILKSFDLGSTADDVKKAPKTKNSNGGKLPKEFWLDRLTKIGGTFTLPRGL